jgi:hypothetical protein
MEAVEDQAEVRWAAVAPETGSGYEVRFPDYLDGYELETEAKGYLTEVRILAGAVGYTLTVYDPARLAQDAADEVRRYGYLALANVIVVPKVTRDEIAKAAALLAQSGFQELIAD